MNLINKKDAQHSDTNNLALQSNTDNSEILQKNVLDDSNSNNSKELRVNNINSPEVQSLEEKNSSTFFSIQRNIRIKNEVDSLLNRDIKKKKRNFWSRSLQFGSWN